MDSEAQGIDAVAQLRQRLAEDGFSLYCQPIGSLAGPAISYPIGEVLIRLPEEEKALVPPGEFLPVLEHYGLMPELDRWVVRHVLQCIAIGSRIPRFSINLSAQTLADRAFPRFLADALEASGVSGECLLFEIDEAEAIALPDYTTRLAAMVGSLGVGIVIDGLGRGSDYFESFKTPCVQFVKVHYSLTRQLIAGEALSADLAALLHVASEMGIEVIAECVEEPSALLRLKKLKIGYAQGFAVYQPYPLDAFVEPLAPPAR